MMTECEVYVLSSGISESVKNSNQINTQIEKQSVVDEESIVVNGEDEKQFLEEDNEGSVVIDEEVSAIDDEQVNEIEENEDGNEEEGSREWMNEFPPLLSKDVQASLANWHGRMMQMKQEKFSLIGDDTRSWVNALKKPHRRIDVKVVKQKSDTCTDGSASNSTCSFSNNTPRVEDDAAKEEQIKLHVLEDEVVEEEQIKLHVLEVEVVKEKQIKLHVLEGEVVKEAIKLQPFQTQDMEFDNTLDADREAEELAMESVMSKQKEIDTLMSILTTTRIALSLNDMDTDAFEQQMLAEERLKTLKKELNMLESSVLKARGEIEVMSRKIEEMGAEKSNKKRQRKRQRRLRLKDSKEVKESRKADYMSQVSSQNLKQEKAKETVSSDSEILKDIQEREVVGESINEGEAELKELKAKLRQKRKEKKLARKQSKKGKTAKEKKMKWIWLMVVMILILLGLLTNIDLQLLQHIVL